MPIQLVRFDASINFNIDAQLKREITAMSWVLGHEGSLSPFMRNVIREKMGELKETLDSKQREVFNNVLSNLEQEALLKAQMIEEEEQEKSNDGSEGNEFAGR